MKYWTFCFCHFTMASSFVISNFMETVCFSVRVSIGTLFPSLAALVKSDSLMSIS